MKNCEHKNTFTIGSPESYNIFCLDCRRYVGSFEYGQMDYSLKGTEYEPEFPVICQDCKHWDHRTICDICENMNEFQPIPVPRISKDDYYLGIALTVSRRSTCLHRHYGCVIVKDDVIIATGYNGNPRGESNCCDIGYCARAEHAAAKDHKGYELCNAVHAEQNALLSAGRGAKGSTVYLACEENGIEWDNPVPCNICKNMLQNAGVEKIINRKEKLLNA